MHSSWLRRAAGFAVLVGALGFAGPAIAAPDSPCPGGYGVNCPTSLLQYEGGTVLTRPRVYVVFWGSGWGAADPQGYPTVDRGGTARPLVDFFRHLGGPGDTWSMLLSQYCSGTRVGGTTCGPSSTHIVHPERSPLAGWWVDTGTAVPVADMGNSSFTTDTQAGETARALAHFRNFDRDDIVLLALPPMENTTAAPGDCGYHSDWHTSFGDRPDIVLPYMDLETGAGGSPCGGCPNGSTIGPPYGIGCADAAAHATTEVASHEYAEVVTDPLLDFGLVGWAGDGGNTSYEIGDECNTGGVLVRLNGKAFAVTQLWSNSAHHGQGGCVNRYTSDRDQR